MRNILNLSRVEFSLLFLLITSPMVAMISGLFMAPWIILIMGIIIYLVGVDIYDIHNQFSYIEHVVVLFVIFSCIWSISPADSLISASRLILVMILAKVIARESHHITLPIQLPLLLLSLGLSIFIFLVEKYNNGLVTIFFREIFQPNKAHYFGLYWLDRGCAFLSLFAWIPIYLFAKKGECKKAFAVYILALFTLVISDSDSSILAFVLASIAYLMSQYKAPSRLLSYGIIAYIFIMPIFAKMQDPYVIKENISQTPLSYMHRLFIWQYAADSAMDNFLLGKGISASSHVEPDHMIQYAGIKMSLMPRHPHNNVIQIWLEFGLVGLIVFAFFIRDILWKISRFKDKHFASASMAIFTNYFVIGMVSFNMWQSWWLFTILYIMLLMNLVKNNE